MSQTFPRSSRDRNDAADARVWGVLPDDAFPAWTVAPDVASGAGWPVPGDLSYVPSARPDPDMGQDAGGAPMPSGAAEYEERTSRKRAWRRRLRFGLGFGFVVSLIFHSSLFALFTGGTNPGVADGQEAIAVDIITQEQMDIMLGDGSTKGGKPPKVDDSAKGTELALRTPAPAAPQKAEVEAEQRQAPNVISAPIAPVPLEKGVAENSNAAAAASATQRKADTKSTSKGSVKESAPAQQIDPKEKPDSPREEARNDSAPTTLRPGSDGGAMRRLASRGGVGDEHGALPPSMRQTLMQILQKQIELCYVPPSNIPQNPELPLVVIKFNRDGSLDGLPKSQRYERTSAGKSMVKAALKAVRQCAPYRMPPRFAPYYEDWREIRAEFEFSSR